MASKEQFYEASIAKWGIDSQLKLFAEECCELAIVALKLKRIYNGSNLPELVEEIADVEIMIEQFCHHYKLRDAIDEWKEQKLRRLAYLLEKSK